jgi:hypothetical protein
MASLSTDLGGCVLSLDWSGTLTELGNPCAFLARVCVLADVVLINTHDTVKPKAYFRAVSWPVPSRVEVIPKTGIPMLRRLYAQDRPIVACDDFWDVNPALAPTDEGVTLVSVAELQDWEVELWTS